MSEEPTISVTVAMSEEDFLVIYKALWRSHLPYTREEAGDIVDMEDDAWDVLQRVATEHGLSPEYTVDRFEGIEEYLP